MGIIRMGPPEELIMRLTHEFEIPNFVETGTYYGKTAVWASHYFKNVFTIEYSQELYQKVSPQYKNVENLHFIWGDSRTQLSQLIEQLEGSTLFWLDAHWSGGLTYGETDQCPLIEEIEILNRSPYPQFILIDDARLFTSPPQIPHKIEQWPEITEVIEVLKVGDQERYIVLIEDVIIAVPSSAKFLVANYCQETNNKLWQEYGKSNFEKGLKLIYQGLKQSWYQLKSKA